MKWDHHDVHVMTMLQYLGLKIVRMTIETNFFLESIGTTQLMEQIRKCYCSKPSLIGFDSGKEEDPFANFMIHSEYIY